MIPSPYLLYLGAATDPLAVKTARGVAEWRPEHSVGQRRLPGCEVSLGLEDMDAAEAARRGARTMIVGEANAGGVLSAAAIPEIVAALEAGLDVASGLHQRLGDVPAIREAAERLGRRLFDVRPPPPGGRGLRAAGGGGGGAPVAPIFIPGGAGGAPPPRHDGGWTSSRGRG